MNTHRSECSDHAIRIEKMKPMPTDIEDLVLVKLPPNRCRVISYTSEPTLAHGAQRKLCRLVCVTLCMQMMSMCDMGVMSSLFVIARLMVFSGFLMVLGGMVVMLSRACGALLHCLLACSTPSHTGIRVVSWGTRLRDHDQPDTTSSRLRADEQWGRKNYGEREVKS